MYTTLLELCNAVKVNSRSNKKKLAYRVNSVFINYRRRVFGTQNCEPRLTLKIVLDISWH